jgi:hypothetical protein
MGQNTIASDYGSLVMGKYNSVGSSVTTNGSATAFDTDNSAFVIGNGTASGSESDALVVYSSGNATLAGDITITGNDITFGNAETISNSTDGTVLINGTVAGGTGSAAGVFQSNGDNDVTLQTGNSTTGSITITDGANGNIAITPNGTGEVDISKIDIASGEIDGTAIGANSATTGAFTTVTASTSLDVTGSAGVILENDETITNSTNGTVLINGTVAGGTGSAAGVFQSNGDYDITLQTGNSTTGSITITDGANGDIAVAPNGTGETTFGGNPISNYSASTVSITSATTLATSHNGKVLICNSGSDFSLTIPEDTLPAGFNVMIVQKGAGEITLAAASGNVTINNRNSHTKTANTWAIMSLICIDATTDANVFVSGGDGAS